MKEDQASSKGTQYMVKHAREGSGGRDAIENYNNFTIN
jgi:hypothetical protein